jgi:hypothetical protein
MWEEYWEGIERRTEDEKRKRGKEEKRGRTEDEKSIV